MPHKPEDLHRAQQRVAAAITAILPLWFVPIVGGPACNFAESFIIGEILKVFGCHSNEAVDSLFWGFRRKMLLLNIATYAPVAGVPLQCWEIYAMGQFAIHCAQDPKRVTDELWMSESWNIVSSDVFCGERAIRAYEEASGRLFPQAYKNSLIKTFDAVHKAYQLANKVPGLVRVQENLTDSMRIGIKGAKEAAKVGAAVSKETLTAIRTRWKRR